jgi:hypothetical protein
MAHTHRTARKSTYRSHIGQLAPQNVPQPSESQPDAPQYASQEEEPFEIELVVPESPMAWGSPAEEEQQLEDLDVEDKADEEYPPPSDTEDEKMYRDGDEVESSGAEALVLIDRLHALLEHLGITTAPRYQIKEVPHLGQWSSKSLLRSSSDPESSADTRDQLLGPHAVTLWLTPPSRPSPHGSVVTRVGCRTPSATSCPIGRRINSRPMG